MTLGGYSVSTWELRSGLGLAADRLCTSRRQSHHESRFGIPNPTRRLRCDVTMTHSAWHNLGRAAGDSPFVDQIESNRRLSRLIVSTIAIPVHRVQAAVLQ
jgi:hypothetical protein